ncbi:MAG: hypothetical protein NVSMB65_15650 [Chloroflexota bacterium]
MAAGAASGSGSWIGRFSASMGVLLSTLWEGRYHSHQPLQGRVREAAGQGGSDDAGQAGGRIGDEALDTGGEPDHTGVAHPLLGRHAHKGERQPVEGMGRVDDRDRLTRENS